MNCRLRVRDGSVKLIRHDGTTVDMEWGTQSDEAQGGSRPHRIYSETGAAASSGLAKRHARRPGSPEAARGTSVTSIIVEEQVVKSRHRVKTYGEVLTPRDMVDRMLDLVRDDLESGPGFVDKTFLEPAAGDGNFLVAILHRKLGAIEKQYPYGEWPETSLFALASIYGIELLEDNHQDAKVAMLATFVRFHEERQVPCGVETDLRRAAGFLIDTNIIRGNTLTGLDPRGNEIQFSWWNRVQDAPGIVQRETFTFSSLRNGAMDFAAHDDYEPCRIDRVHEQGRSDA